MTLIWRVLVGIVVLLAPQLVVMELVARYIVWVIESVNPEWLG